MLKRRLILITTFLLLEVTVLWLPAWGAGGDDALVVFAASSLTDAFHEIGLRFQERQPGLNVRFNFAGSQELAARLEQGAEAEVFASADHRWMDQVQKRQLLAGQPRVMARNRLVVIVPAKNLARIDDLADLARKRIKLVIAADAVPAGRYSREMLLNLSRAPGFGQDFSRRVLARVVSEEEDVRSVADKVRLGEADAGIVYRSDVTPSISRQVRMLAIPEVHNVVASYPIAVLGSAKHPETARAFVQWVLSPEGQEVLRKHGFVPGAGATGPQ
jgi:molybdate transport system substrate-binding protein